MKSEVYTWRVSPEVKAALEAEARREKVSMAKLLDDITRRWLAERRASAADDAAEQARLHAAAEKWIGKLRGNDPLLSQSVRKLVREKLAKKYGRKLSN